ncbi:MAG TPA: PilZ domain-containing protein [Kofleriaceae bacterium]|nr:PilZ domain-containing protein [Kofleriaceae bacterium]
MTSNNVEVFRHLGSVPFRRLKLEHHVAADAASVPELVRAVKPDLVLLDATMNGESGFRVCRALKDDAALGTLHVILLLSQVITRDELDGLELSRCDDVLALPIASEDFYHHLAQIVGLPLRRAPRVGIDLMLLLPDRSESTRGTVMNVSATGLGVRVARDLESGQQLTARLRYGEEVCDVSGRVAWSHAAEEGEPGFIAGIELFSDIPIRTRLLLEELALFDVVPADATSELGGGVLVTAQGDFTEAVNFAALAERLAPEQQIVFDMARVRYVSSAGVKAWCDLVAMLGGKKYVFRHISLAFASQASMVPMVLGEGTVLSAEAPYHCPTCQRDELRLLETKSLFIEEGNVTPPVLRCIGCGGELEFDDVPNRYFAYLRNA